MVEQPQKNEYETEPSDSGQTGVLRRLLKMRHQGDAEPEYAPILPASPRLTPSRAAGMALSRAGNLLYELPIQTESVEVGGMTLAELPELLPEKGLLAVLQGPNDAMGVMALCIETVTSLIEIQSLGRVTARAVRPRRLTRADALLCADFVNAALEELAVELASINGFDGIGGFRYASYLTEARPLGLILDDKPHRCLSFKVNLGGKRDASIFVGIPLAGAGDGDKPSKKIRQISASQPEQIMSETHTHEVPEVQATLRENVQEAPIEVVGVLCRRMVTLGELQALEPGGIFQLPRADLSKVQVELPDGRVLVTGKLGESGGCHAIRLHDPAMAESGDGTDMGMSFGHQAASGSIDQLPEEGGFDPLPADDAFTGDFDMEDPMAATPMDDMMPIDLSAADEFRDGNGSPEIGGFEGFEVPPDQEANVA